MAEPGKKDEKAPRFLEISIRDSDGNSWGTLTANAKTFTSGSVGFYASGKVKNAEGEAKYQCGMNITLIGSKPE
jgi:hypothetical protein